MDRSLVHRFVCNQSIKERKTGFVRSNKKKQINWLATIKVNQYWFFSLVVFVCIQSASQSVSRQSFSQFATQTEIVKTLLVSDKVFHDFKNAQGEGWMRNGCGGGCDVGGGACLLRKWRWKQKLAEMSWKKFFSCKRVLKRDLIGLTNKRENFYCTQKHTHTWIDRNAKCVPFPFRPLAALIGLSANNLKKSSHDWWPALVRVFGMSSSCHFPCLRLCFFFSSLFFAKYKEKTKISN